MKSIIYGLIDIDTLELRYVGQTTKPLAVRFKQHMSLCSRNIHLNNWLRAADVNIVVLECDPVDLDEAEMCWIADMREHGERLLNMTDGGGGINGHEHTAETRVKMSIARIGHTVSVETRARISVANKGKQSARGRVVSVATRAKISAAMKGNQNALKNKKME